jgi:ubiquinone/menaquinone biosynthesis C-methylase UbiE
MSPVGQDAKPLEASDDPESERARSAIIERTKDTYARYASSGYAERWLDQSAGSVIGLREREMWLRDALCPTAGGTLLDVGCGAGALAIILAHAGCSPARYIGVDIIESSLAEAREAVPRGEFLLSSADRIELADEVVDSAAALTLFSSVPDDWFRRRVAAEITRVLRPGGRLVVYDLRYPSPGNRAVRPVTRGALTALFPGWALESRTLTLLPPLMRSPLAANPRRYRALIALPFLRSHLGAVLTKPG